ncbi:hypothetical protein CJJ09_003754 [Candidozyma auris]|nr:hypothetical protein CJJ09_003754 [[Candida] auris]
MTGTSQDPGSKSLSEDKGSTNNGHNDPNLEHVTPSACEAESPTKTPTRRVGLQSPAKRAPSELDLSARKKAASTYSRLMNEEADDEDNILRQQELNLAEQIIQDSKQAESPPEEKGKTKKGRSSEKTESSGGIDSKKKRTKSRCREKRGREGSRKEAFGRGKDQEGRKKKRIGREKEAEEASPSATVGGEEGERRKSPESDDSEEEDGDSTDEEGFSESEDEKPKRPKRKVSTPRKPRAPARSESPTPSKAAKLERRTKKGRPIFQDRSNSAKGTPVEEPKAKPSISLNFDNTGDSSFSYIPQISGLSKKPQPNAEVTPIQQFEPLPVPELNRDGTIKDKSYIEKYFPNADIDLNFPGRLVDERAYFLEGSEGYFEQHNLRFRPSSSALSSRAPELEYDEFLPMVKLGSLIHKNELEALRSLHKNLYHQYCFELSQGYNLNFYGIGSKSEFVLDFVNNYLLDWYEQVLQEDDEYPVVMVANGYNPATKLKPVIYDIASAIITPEVRKQKNIKMPKHMSEAFPFLVTYMKKQVVRHQENGLVKPRLILVVHNIDGEAFRDERSQNILSQLASLPDVWLITSVDNVNASLLWDLYRFKNFNFLWHEATTYTPYSVELSFKDVLGLGRSKKFVGSKGAKYVLTSLSSNAQNLYRVLSEMQLKVLEDAAASKSGRTGLRGSIKLGVEFKKLYEQCLMEYVTSNEMNFRSILGEYVEHKMCSLTKNASGKEIVFIPYAYDEIALILRDHFQK